MALTESTNLTEEVTVRRRIRTTRYHWPALQLNFWLLIMLIGSSTIMGIFANFIIVQQQMDVGIPWCVSAPRPVPSLPFPMPLARMI
jgi:hypothetical protein